MTSDEFDDLQSLLRNEPRAMQQYVKFVILSLALKRSHENGQHNELNDIVKKKEDLQDSLKNSHKGTSESKVCLLEREPR